ncbi:NAD(P)H-quinone oxidoreductase [Variovorax defluvii]|uniref:NAD(P)H-quinone oxidoreductase n=1 Tax=Variovorax defluvii TaxID=913761 RepID=A0ABP8HYG1_9BURK
MKAAYFEKTGGVEVLEFGERPDPICGVNDVLIRVRATSLDRFDIYGREASHGMRWPLPHVGGGDIAGHIAEIGVGARESFPQLKVGDAVFALGRHAHAEVAAAPAILTLPVPKGWSFESAAALPMAGRTAFDALNRIRIRSGEDVLIVAGASGVGSYAIQIARTAGCRVITTVGSEDKFAKALETGAHEVINHYTEDGAARVKGFTNGSGVHAVLDHVGTPMFDAAFESLRPNGRFVSTGVTAGHKASLHLGKLFFKGIELHGIGRADQPSMRKSIEGLVALAERGLLKPVVHTTFPLEQIAEAHRLMESSRFFGKIVLTVAGT